MTLASSLLGFGNCVMEDRCSAAFEAGRKYEREQLPFTEDCDPADDLVDTMMHGEG